MSVAIRATHLSKSYSIAAARQRHDTLRDVIVESAGRLLRRGGAASRRETVWALRDVSFDIHTGEAVGLVGRNGAGKSTLLKLLSRITRPTGGRAEVFGRIGSLLEVGTGFDRELSGRENVYLSGAVLGMRKAEIDRQFDAIVNFSEVGQFIDTPVKRYSSGMYLRLAFAVAAHLDPEILLLDEVLAVGDAAFQKRCLGKMQEVAGRGRTVVFVSHNMAAVARFCTRCIWVDKGVIRADGAVNDVIGEYLASGSEDSGEATFPDDDTAPGSEYIRLLALRVRGDGHAISASLDASRPCTLEVEYRILRPATGLRIGVTLLTSEGIAILSSKDTESLPSGHDDYTRPVGRYVSRCTIPGDFLNYGQYFVSAGSDFPGIQSHFSFDRGVSFTIERTGGVGGHLADTRAGFLRALFPWEIETAP